MTNDWTPEQRLKVATAFEAIASAMKRFGDSIREVGVTPDNLKELTSKIAAAQDIMTSTEP